MSAFRLAHAAGADHLGDVAGQLIALFAPDGLLDLGVEILHPDRGAVHPRCGQRIQPGVVNLVRVDLDRELARPRPSGPTAKIASASARIMSGGSMVGVPPPQCRRDSVHAGGRWRARRAISACSVFGIGEHRIIRCGALRAAGAEPAQAAAERHMQVERDLRPCRDRLDPVGEIVPARRRRRNAARSDSWYSAAPARRKDRAG